MMKYPKMQIDSQPFYKNRIFLIASGASIFLLITISILFFLIRTGSPIGPGQSNKGSNLPFYNQGGTTGKTGAQSVPTLGQQPLSTTPSTEKKPVQAIPPPKAEFGRWVDNSKKIPDQIASIPQKIYNFQPPLTQEEINQKLPVKVTPSPEMIYRYHFYITRAQENQLIQPPKLSPIQRAQSLIVEFGAVNQ